MRIVTTIQNIWKIEDLRKRILITLGFVAIYLFGTYVVIPGVDPKALTALSSQTRGGLMALLDMFSGGAFSNASIFALGIMPYISASIVMQLVTILIPSFQKLQREGESGRKKINQLTRYLTVIILVVQGFAYLTNLDYQMRMVGSSLPPGMWYRMSSIIIMAAGSMFVLWLGERITDKGIGNGISFIIMIGIINRLPRSLMEEFTSRMNERGKRLIIPIMMINEMPLPIPLSVIRSPNHNTNMLPPAMMIMDAILYHMPDGSDEPTIRI
jgi:preprotein translocase subunit SecY